MNKAIPVFSGEAVEKIEQSLLELVSFEVSGISHERLTTMLQRCLLPHLMRYDSTSFQSHFNYTIEEAAKTAAHLVLDYNQNVTNWQVSPGGSTLETLCCRELCKLFGMGSEADATFTYSGTYANQEAIYLALRRFTSGRKFSLAQRGLQDYQGPRLLVAASSEVHHLSLIHAVRMLGLGEDSIVQIPLDKKFRMSVPALQTILADTSNNGTVFCVACSAGTTQTGAVDPIQGISELCIKKGIWLHVDGAYGFAYRLIPELKSLFEGVELADSVSWDPHKQLCMPIPTSMLFVKRREDFNMMSVHGNYFNELDGIGHNPGLKSPPTSRPMSVLPLVVSLRALGLRKVIERLRAPIAAIGECAREIKKLSDLRLVVEPNLGILCLELAQNNLELEIANRVHSEIQARITAGGLRTLSKALLNGRLVLRLVAISPDITASDLMETVNEIRRVAAEVLTDREKIQGGTRPPRH